MKYIYLFITILFVNTSACKAQMNTLTETEYFNIQFNTTTLGELQETEGNIVEIQNLLSNDIEMTPNTTGPFPAKDFFNNHIYLHFEDESGTGSQYDLTYIKVKDSSISVTIKDRVVKIGDSVTKLGNVTLTNSNQGYYSIVFVDDLGSSSLDFKINPLTNKISEIKFISF